MSPYFRRARLRVLAVVAVVAFGGPLTDGLSATSRPLAEETGVCGRSWSSARRLSDLPRNLTEVSGFVSSARHRGTAWMIRDSGNPHSLYSFELRGNQPQWHEFPVKGVSNVDWEDVTYTVGSDGRGRIWIFENAFAPGAKKLYEVIEPDPGSPGPVPVAATYRLEYPGTNLDTESVFVAGGRFTFVTRTSPNRVWQAATPLSSTSVNHLTELGHLQARSLLAAAATSADERLLMTVGVVDTVTVFEAPTPASDGFVGQAPIFRHSMPDTQREAGDFFPYDSCDIVLVSEDATVWRLSNGGTVTALDHPQEPSTAPPPAAPQPAPSPAPAPTRDAGEPAPARNAPGGRGYWLLSADGAVHPFGDVDHHGGGTAGTVAAAAKIEPTGTGQGYWVLDGAGRIGAFGDAPHLGDAGAGLTVPGEHATSLARTPSGAGYWIFTDRGRALPFGDAPSLGDLAEHTLNGPVLDAVPTPTGLGYYMVGSDGGVFTFGDARFSGSMGAVRLNAPVESLVPDPDGSGYWLVASDGGVFAFDAPFRGSLGHIRLNQPIAAMAAYGDGYLLVAVDGGVFNFSDQSFHGSLASRPPDAPVVAIAVP